MENVSNFPPPPEDEAAEATTWEPIDLEPWLAGDIASPEPTVGISRTDGVKLLYPGREHTVFGETEAGKSWLALECIAVEIRLGNDVVYIHFEEGDPASTIERLRLLAVTPAQIARHLRFAAPARPVCSEWLEPLLAPQPVLVILDGVNEGMSLHGDQINDADGAATFRRNIVKPFTAVGAAVLSCDHVTKNSESRGRYAIGSAHKLNAIDGAAFLMENIAPFGRGLRGASSIYVTKDRPGQLRAEGTPVKGVAGKTFIGVLAVDATGDSPDFLTFYPPKADGGEESDSSNTKKVFALAEIGDMIYDIVATAPDATVTSRSNMFAMMRHAGHQFRDTAMTDAANVLVVAGRLKEVPGKRGATGYRAVLSSSQTSTLKTLESTTSATPSPTSSPIGTDGVGRGRTESSSDLSVRGGTRSDEVGDEASCGACDKELLTDVHQAAGLCAKCLPAAAGAPGDTNAGGEKTA
jgi:hypothetical protein